MQEEPGGVFFGSIDCHCCGNVRNLQIGGDDFSYLPVGQTAAFVGGVCLDGFFSFAGVVLSNCRFFGFGWNFTG